MLLKDPAWYLGGAFFVNAGRAAGEDHSFGVEVFYRVPGALGLGDHGVDFQFANAAGYQVAVLRAEIDDDDALVHRFLTVIIVRPNTLQPFGDLEVGRHLQIVAGGDPSSLG